MNNAEWMIKQGYKFRELVWKRENIEKYDYDILLNNKCIGKVKGSYPSCVIQTWLDMEHIEPILDDAEREYLSAVIRPFRNDVYSIEKEEQSQCEMICIGTKKLRRIRYMVFPPFEKGTMYKGMENGRTYTLEELGL